jgi:hypothetical protein
LPASNTLAYFDPTAVAKKVFSYIYPKIPILKAFVLAVAAAGKYARFCCD